MYKWIDEVKKVVDGLKGEINDNKTRVKVTGKIIDILNDHEVTARVDCSANVNTGEVVRYGEFRAVVDTGDIVIEFKKTKEK